MIDLDFTSDSCGIFASMGEEEAADLQSLDGNMIEHEDDADFCYVMIGEAWDDEGWRDAWPALTEQELNTKKDRYYADMRRRVIAEIEAAGLDWQEV